ncbi:conserved Plasmodium protein, unknown function [Plasmodium berghei]|uniref:Uncharacterized protein n=2 Tax=Plasmodium berghei TaxID=5821 RepID=A0A509AQP1_PLABA|nr:conserved protein, unknown function [Plasmodium berghei ANKA]SCL93956.1 conserved Plasmodium protein, unknown function [Plasmodium berghei]SCM15912.1 conserved Plasmodium protein, unknown function [Plasmodium berghei]SCM17708.1 conserved Plasmodium protein, unknown function [Plasmodium berghei]SCN25875.1 conserved Plasmodium protein, unknown function [Plasmodium berghei]VUC56035.1 conserved protein, unknown function [Plasmodium berghei ANKA]|eukprot:XP_034421837.1 conserved protein, unknown function [Plasmodium berghei ANKA]
MKELIGRSRNERKLDGIYNKQRDVLINQHKNNLNKYNHDIYSNLSKRKVNESIPFPEIYENKKKKINNEANVSDDKKKNDVAKDKDEKNNPETLNNENHNINGNGSITIYKGIYMIIYKHIHSKNKFAKSVDVFVNICINYMNNDNKNIFFYSIDKLITVFHEKYLYAYDIKTTYNVCTFHNDHKLHLKSMLSLCNNVLNKIIDNVFVIANNEESKNNNLNKSFDNNDEVSLHKNEAPQHSPELIDNEKDKISDANSLNTNSISSQKNLNNEEINFDKKKKNTVNITKEEKKFLKALKIKLYYLIILFKLNDNFVFNKLMSIYRQIFEEILNEYNIFEQQIAQDKEKEKIPKNQAGKEMDTNTNESHQKHIDHINPFEQEKNKINGVDVFDEQHFILIKDQWEIPNEYEIYKIKRNAFVKCLSHLINFINLNWAKTLVESLLQDVYLKKYIFDTCDEIIIENLQSTVKSNINKRKNKHDSYHVLSIGESLNPIKDAREEKIVSLHGSHVWSNKQMER